MKGLNSVSKRSKTAHIAPVALYYSVADDTVYTEPKSGRYLVTYLIRQNTPKEVEEAVHRWLAL